ncbi:MAG: DUF3662 domain-containing protein [Acidimicrobiia bacterium]|nr:DUF3662 domain-containing protein [Acidimicrobiia bacterium]
MGLRDVERRIERGVEGAVGRLFRSSVSRVEVAKRVERELDSGVRSGLLGHDVMPNEITVRLNIRDLTRLDVPSSDFERELVAHARAHARAAECGFDGPLVVRVMGGIEVPVGTMDVLARTEATVSGVVPGTLVHPDGARFDLTIGDAAEVIVGRDGSVDLVIDDDLASRRHARLRSTERGWVLEDLESTNGTRVNGFRTRAQLLTDGDNITIGATTFGFETS